MMERLFLVSEVPAGYGQQVIQTISHQFQPIIALTKQFENVTTLMEQYPTVTWVVVDIERSRDWVAQFLKEIPAPNYIVNFSGAAFAGVALDALQSCGNEYKERERGRSELTFFGGMVKPEDGLNCNVFINVVEKRSGLEKKSRGMSKMVGKIVKGATKTLSNLVEDDDVGGDEESTPLLNQDRSPTSGITEPITFLQSLLSCCCPCIFGPPELQYRFQTPSELRAYLRTEQTSEIQKAFKKLHDRLYSSWGNSLAEIRKKEEQKLEELTLKVEGMKEQEQKRLGDVSDQQNKNTRTNLSGVLGEDTIKKIELSRSRQNKSMVDCDTSRAFKEGKELIRKQVAIDRAQLQERHYANLLHEQIKKLTEIQSKYQQKAQTLHARYFGNNSANA